MSKKFIIGIDEVGRGALAGPVVVAAVLLPRHLRFKNLKDSKKLAAAKREKWFDCVKNEEKGIFYSLARVFPSKIDKINITRAANLAATRALLKLTDDYQLTTKNFRVLLDGGLYLIGEQAGRTIIKGDEKYNCIKLASIVAKVKRDRYMKKLHTKYPAYGFHKHKGYGTKEHFKALRKHGPSEVHRLTFIRKYFNMK